MVVNFNIFYNRLKSVAAFLFLIYKFMLRSSMQILIEKVGKRVYGSDRDQEIIIFKLYICTIQCFVVTDSSLISWIQICNLVRIILFRNWLYGIQRNYHNVFLFYFLNRSYVLSNWKTVCNLWFIILRSFKKWARIAKNGSWLKEGMK